MLAQFLVRKLKVVLVLLITVSSTYSIHKIWDQKFQDEWTGTCASGLWQSPVAIPNIEDRTLTKFMKLEFTNMQFPIKKFTVVNAGRHTIFEWPRNVANPPRFFVLKTSEDVSPFHADTPYILQNFHVHHNLDPHTGTNHAINGSVYAMEMHFLFVLPKYDDNYLAAFEAGPGNTLEIVVLWRLSDVHNSVWSQLNNLMLSKKLSENQTITSGETNLVLSDFIPSSSTFSLHHGSMIFYRCLEVNTWIVFDEVMDFDTADLGMRHWKYVSDGKVTPLYRNIRHIQSLNGRPVYHGREQEVVYIEPLLENQNKK